MIIDSLLAFSEEQAVTATAVSTNVVDTGADHNEGPGENMYVFVGVAEAAAAAGAATVTVDVQTSDVEGSGYVTVQSTGAIPIADLGLGDSIKMRLPMNLQRYVRLNYTVGTGPLTAGAFNAYLVKDVDAVQYGASGFSVE